MFRSVSRILHSYRPSPIRSVHAAVCEGLSSPLVYRDIDTGATSPLAKGTLKISVIAAGINFGDILQCQGKYQEKQEPPFVPGMEYVGKVIEVGPGVDSNNIEVGDRVICLGTGGFAEEAIVPAQGAFRIPRDLPESIDVTEAAGLLVSYGTAHLALTSRGNIQKGETVLVTAAAGGVGLASVELAQAMGARVIAAAGSDEKVEIAVAKGGPSALGFNYAGCDGKEFRSKLKEVAGKGGVDVLVDAVGGEFLEAGIRSLNWDGRAVVIGFAGGDIPKIPANILLVKNVSVSGLYWGAHTKHNPKLFLQSSSHIIKMWAEGKLKPHISHRFPLDKVNDAFSVIQSRKSTGKVVLIP
eukprot:CAMPEP_0185025264 /NCGR_PEP_ID=MMETSP1103-20130426/8286_1 /TAXON_ID=36769 /ORGANISM="Paraphysomonas bandaiensis, Strain Caron Lab Isolate" /LENGTH=354 /DNA_ID=CAMNT_0027558417 /DNA_START=35 /DNA_END=1099 /DNA_ORIENTATION=+